MIIRLAHLSDLLRQAASRIMSGWRIGRVSCVGVLSLLLFSPFSAHAWGNTWVFPGAMPSGCSQKSSTSFTCGSLSLNGDTVTINTSGATTITFSGDLSVSQTNINTSGSASNLTLTVNGTLNPGYNSNINANVAAYAVSGGSATTFGGNVQATNGVVNLGYQSTVAGSITDTTGTITLGTQMTVGGSIIGGTGKITVGDSTSITGTITSTTGDVSLSNSVKASGITSTSGDISVSDKGTISGALTSTSGSITLDNEATAISITSDTGAVTVNYSAYVCSNIATDRGTINLYGQALVGGNITSTSGLIVLWWGARIHGYVKTDGILLNLGATTNDTSLVIASCTILQPPATPPSSFNAFESSTSSADVTKGVILTKIAGNAFSLDIAALKESQLYTTFTGTVTVDLVDGSSSSACSARSALGSSGTVTFATSNAGRLTASFPAGYSNSNAWRDVQVRMTYQQSSSSKIIACSTDHFAIRPASLSVAVTDTGWETAGTSRNLDTTYTHKAGRPFTINSKALIADGKTIASNYNGTPVPVIESHTDPKPSLIDPNPNKCTSTPTTSATATCTISAPFTNASGILTTDAATYSEVGSFNMYLQDADFASIDKDDAGADYIIKSSTVPVGRFIPDHFTLTESTVTPGCSSGNFTYIGQPFSAFAYTIEAQNAFNVATQNYDGTRAAVALVAENGDNGVNLANDRLTVPKNTDSWNSGIYSFNHLSVPNPIVFRRRNMTSDATAAPDGPFDSLQLGVKVTDTDGVLLANRNMNAATAGDGGTTNADSVRLGAPTRMRFGRLKLYNAHGSDRLNLPVPMRAEYYNGTAFATNTADSCTSISSSNVAITAYKGGLSASTMPKTNITAGGTFSKGISKLRLLKPTSSLAKRGSVDLCVNLSSDLSTDSSACSAASSAGMPWLQGNWRGPTYEYDPKSRATFGVFKNANELIYIREMY